MKLINEKYETLGAMRNVHTQTQWQQNTVACQTSKSRITDLPGHRGSGINSQLTFGADSDDMGSFDEGPGIMRTNNNHHLRYF